MAVPAATLQTYQATNNAEDVSDIIYNLSPADTPLQSLVKRGKAEGVFSQWNIDSLAAVDPNNAVIEGDDAANDTLTQPAFAGNYVQLSDKVWQVSTTQNSVKAYGMGRTRAYQRMKKMKELKRDRETIYMANQASVAGAAATARKLRGLPSWITTNTSRGVGGANGSTAAAATDGTQRNFTEALLRAVVVAQATNSSEMASIVMAGPANRTNLSTQLSGNNTRFHRMDKKTLNATITVYDSDHGPLQFVMNRYQRDRDMFLINPDFLEIRYLQGFKEDDLAKTGHADRGMYSCEATLAVLNEAAHAVIADLNTAVL